MRVCDLRLTSTNCVNWSVINNSFCFSRKTTNCRTCSWWFWNRSNSLPPPNTNGQPLLYWTVLYHRLSLSTSVSLIAIHFIVRQADSVFSWELYVSLVRLANGLLSTLDQARNDDDADLNFQIENFYEDQKRDEEEFLGNFDQNDHQAVYQAIQLQVCWIEYQSQLFSCLLQLPPGSHEAGLFLTAMQLLYTNLTSAKDGDRWDIEAGDDLCTLAWTCSRPRILQSLLHFISKSAEKSVGKKTTERAVQTDPLIVPPPVANVPIPPETGTSTVTLTNSHPLPDLINSQKPKDIPARPPVDIDLQTTHAVTSRAALPPPPPPPFPEELKATSSTIGSSVLPPPMNGPGGPPPPPPPPPFPVELQTNWSCMAPPPPPPLPSGPGGPPPPPPAPGQMSVKPSTVGLSVLVDSIPKPKGKLRRLQWKKLPQTILGRCWPSIDHLHFHFLCSNQSILDGCEQQDWSTNRFLSTGRFLQSQHRKYEHCTRDNKSQIHCGTS